MRSYVSLVFCIGDGVVCWFTEEKSFPRELMQGPYDYTLSFADDLIAFLNGDRHTVECFTRVLQEFKACSGLEFNQQKTQMFCASMIDK